MNVKKKNCIDLCYSLSNNLTEIISKTIINSHDCINWGSNGIGNRFCYKYFNYIIVYKSKYKKYLDDDEICVDEKKINEFQQHNSGLGAIGIFLLSVRINNIQRPVKSCIKKEIGKRVCVVCGSNTDIVCDHKNDLYDDIRVLSIKTQTIDDFQSLCNHCNLQKRQVSIEERKISNLEKNSSMRIYSAKNIPQLKILDIDFPWEKTNTKKECYWYDPLEFYRKIKIYMLLKPCMNEIKKVIKHNKPKWIMT